MAGCNLNYGEVYPMLEIAHEYKDKQSLLSIQIDGEQIVFYSSNPETQYSCGVENADGNARIVVNFGKFIHLLESVRPDRITITSNECILTNGVGSYQIERVAEAYGNAMPTEKGELVCEFETSLVRSLCGLMKQKMVSPWKAIDEFNQVHLITRNGESKISVSSAVLYAEVVLKGSGSSTLSLPLDNPILKCDGIATVWHRAGKDVSIITNGLRVSFPYIPAYLSRVITSNPYVDVKMDKKAFVSNIKLTGESDLLIITMLEDDNALKFESGIDSFTIPVDVKLGTFSMKRVSKAMFRKAIQSSNKKKVQVLFGTDSVTVQHEIKIQMSELKGDYVETETSLAV